MTGMILLQSAGAALAESPARPAFDLAESSLLSEETHVAIEHALKNQRDWVASHDACTSGEKTSSAAMRTMRECQLQAFYQTSAYKEMRDSYATRHTLAKIGGVYAEVFTPMSGIAQQNLGRVLVNLHSGAFNWGARTASFLESVPIASVGRIKVISVDYRLAPEHSFPAASEDVAAVYRELLKRYKPKAIGLYGSSAGALLVAQSIAWFQKEDLPLPGAVGMFCAGASYWADGDSGQIGAALSGRPVRGAKEEPYFKNADFNDPLVFPARSAQVMAHFPPSLLITATRDMALSSVAHTHSILIQQGVAAELHVLEGLGHVFFLYPDIPESREVYRIATSFFDRTLDRDRP